MNPPTFFIAPCSCCQQDVLGHRTLDVQGQLGWQCVRCDQPLDPQQGRWESAQSLDELGFFLEKQELEPHGDSGCRGGSCGVRQPEHQN